MWDPIQFSKTIIDNKLIVNEVNFSLIINERLYFLKT